MRALIAGIAVAWTLTSGGVALANDSVPVRPLRIALYEPRSTLGARVTELFGDALLTELRKLDLTSVISSGEVSQMLSFEQQKQLAG